MDQPDLRELEWLVGEFSGYIVLYRPESVHPGPAFMHVVFDEALQAFIFRLRVHLVGAGLDIASMVLKLEPDGDLLRAWFFTDHHPAAITFSGDRIGNAIVLLSDDQFPFSDGESIRTRIEPVESGFVMTNDIVADGSPPVRVNDAFYHNVPTRLDTPQHLLNLSEPFLAVDSPEESALRRLDYLCGMHEGSGESRDYEDSYWMPSHLKMIGCRTPGHRWLRVRATSRRSDGLVDDNRIEITYDGHRGVYRAWVFSSIGLDPLVCEGTMEGERLVMYSAPWNMRGGIVRVRLTVAPVLHENGSVGSFMEGAVWTPDGYERTMYQHCAPVHSLDEALLE
ncbi:MAG: hypothetical protein SNJ74_08275 [Fimbriimonadaceae bacterium]